MGISGWSHRKVERYPDELKTYLRESLYKPEYVTHHNFDRDLVKGIGTPAQELSLELKAAEGRTLELAVPADPRAFSSLRNQQPEMYKWDRLVTHKLTKHRSSRSPKVKSACDQLRKLQKALREHPLFSADFKEMGANRKDYSKSQAFADRMHAMRARVSSFFGMHRWAGIPVGVALLTLKLTFGLWLLHQFDKLFGTKSVKGEPFSSPAQCSTPHAIGVRVIPSAVYPGANAAAVPASRAVLAEDATSYSMPPSSIGPPSYPSSQAAGAWVSGAAQSSATQPAVYPQSAYAISPAYAGSWPSPAGQNLVG